MSSVPADLFVPAPAYGGGAPRSSETARSRQDGLGEVLRHPGIWRRSAPVSNARAQSTGWQELDAVLPGGGWPLGALSEILFEADGLGELGLVMPTLATLTRQRKRVAFVAPPYQPYAPALANHGLDLAYVVRIDADSGDDAWSAEQCLRSGSCAAVLCWPGRADDRALRRLQVAAETGQALAFVCRGQQALHNPSPAALRIAIDTRPAQWRVLKCRGGLSPAAPIACPVRS